MVELPLPACVVHAAAAAFSVANLWRPIFFYSGLFYRFEASDKAIECMHNQYLCNRQISVQYAYKKDTRGERHGGQVWTVLLVPLEGAGGAGGGFGGDEMGENQTFLVKNISRLCTAYPPARKFHPKNPAMRLFSAPPTAVVPPPSSSSCWPFLLPGTQYCSHETQPRNCTT